MEVMNGYYNFEIISDGKEIKIKTKNHTEAMAFFNFTDNKGIIIKNIMKTVQYINFEKWVHGLEIHRGIYLTKELNLNELKKY